MVALMLLACAGCRLLGLESLPCDAVSDCAPGDACTNGICSPTTDALQDPQQDLAPTLLGVIHGAAFADGERAPIERAQALEERSGAVDVLDGAPAVIVGEEE